jgi:ATP-binding cassette subfamily F protein 3
LLFLDEPTNDLDIPSQEALETVLSSYGGAMVVVSHDRYLLQRVAERVLWLRDGQATLLDGGYERFEAAQRPGAAPPPAAPPVRARTASPPPSERDDRLRKERETRELSACEGEVARLDAERARLEREFADPLIYDDRPRVERLQRELDTARAALDAAFERWERLAQLAAT